MSTTSEPFSSAHMEVTAPAPPPPTTTTFESFTSAPMGLPAPAPPLRTVTIVIPSQLNPLLAGKQLCIARKVTPEYNIVWGTAPISATTVFSWNDDFQAFHKEFPFAFEAGKQTEPDDRINVNKGQILIIDRNGNMSVPETAVKDNGANKGKPRLTEGADHILVKNNNANGGVRVGLCGALSVNLIPATDKTPFFIQHFATIIGQVEIFPLQKVLIWLGDMDGANAVKTGDIFTTALGVCEVDLTTADAGLLTVVPVGISDIAWSYADSTGKIVISASDWKGGKLLPWPPSHLLPKKDDGDKSGGKSKDDKQGGKPAAATGTPKTTPPAVNPPAPAPAPSPAAKPSEVPPKNPTHDTNPPTNEGTSASTGKDQPNTTTTTTPPAGGSGSAMSV